MKRSDHSDSLRTNGSLYIYNRLTRSIEEETIFEPGVMNFLYGSRFGFALTELFLKYRFATEFYARLMHSPKSKSKIKGFIEKYGINLDEIQRPLESFTSFNDFFIRKLKPEARPIDPDPNHLISIADCRLSVYEISERGVFPVKAKSFTAAELLGDETLARGYIGGQCLIFRLAPVDYHRFCYVDDCVQSPAKTINGFYRTVHPLSLRWMKDVFIENRREYCILKTINFGDVIHVNVGATSVGRIVLSAPQGGSFKRGDEKGYFEFGGSTSILLLKSKIAKIDGDIIEYSAKGIETIVRYGERIGVHL